MTLSLDSAGGTWRRQQWLDAGSPAADMQRIAYGGADEVRWVLESALDRLPPEVRWFAVEAIDWIEVGRRAIAWASHAPSPRSLVGDIPHRIVIDGRVRDCDLPGLFAHEISHRWRKPVAPEAPVPMPLAGIDMLAAAIYAMRTRPDDERSYMRAVYVGRRVAEEMRADEQARAWGFEWRGHDYDEIRRCFARDYDEARRLAGLAAELDDNSDKGAA